MGFCKLAEVLRYCRFPILRPLMEFIMGTIVILLLLWPAPALATTWYPVAAASQGQQQQFVDLDSVQPLGLGQVRVASYYIDSRSGIPQQTSYLTDYDCRRRWFRDVEYNGPTGSSAWMPVDPDPLNAAAMDYVCNLVAP
jgi:hypothetical protein